jgi:hypothetical protein
VSAVQDSRWVVIGRAEALVMVMANYGPCSQQVTDAYQALSRAVHDLWRVEADPAPETPPPALTAHVANVANVVQLPVRERKPRQVYRPGVVLRCKDCAELNIEYLDVLEYRRGLSADDEKRRSTFVTLADNFVALADDEVPKCG